MLMPGFSNQRVPRNVRLFIAFSVTLELTPLLSGEIEKNISGIAPVALIRLFLSETLIGTLIGFLARIYFGALETLGGVIAMSIGLTRAVSERSELKGDSRIANSLIHYSRRGKEAAGMALSDDLRTRVVEAVIERGLSRNAAAERFGVSVASAVRWVKRFETTGEIYPARTGGDRRSDRIEAHRDYLLGLIRRAPDMTLLEIQERLVANCGERFSSSVLWRFFDRCNITFKKSPRMPRSSSARTF